MNIFLFITFSFFIGVTATFFLLKPKIKSAEKIDEEIKQQNLLLKESQINLNKENSELLNQISSLKIQKQEILNGISDLEKQSKETSKILYESSQAILNEQMDSAAKKASESYKEAENKARENYLQVLKDYNFSFAEQIKEKEQTLAEIEAEIKDLLDKNAVAVKAWQRAEEMSEKQDFYRLQLTELDIEEIEKLRKVSSYLRDQEPLNKVIWKVYYEKPYSDLINRVIGAGVHSGIYKITNIQNHKCYVGQAVDLASRWKQHIKRGIGAEPLTRNKLYPAMLKYHVENFTFEVIEECDRALLNEREDYWQDYFKAKEYGYSIK